MTASRTSHLEVRQGENTATPHLAPHLVRGAGCGERSRTCDLGQVRNTSSVHSSLEFPPGHHQHRHLQEHLATHDVLLEYYQLVTGVCRRAGNSWVAKPLAKPEQQRSLSRRSTARIPNRGGYPDFFQPSDNRRPLSLHGGRSGLLP
jgi:hypothetical protein